MTIPAVKCPICDAEPREPCYDPRGGLAFKESHAGRMEAAMQAEIERRTAEQDTEHHQHEINRINREISRLIASRSQHEKLLRAAEDRL